MCHRLFLSLLLVAAGCSFHKPTGQEQAIMHFMRHPDPQQGYFGPAPSTYEPVSFSAPRKCRFWELRGDHAAPDDTAVVGVAIEHVYCLQGQAGELEEYTEDFIVSPDGQASFIRH